MSFIPHSTHSLIQIITGTHQSLTQVLTVTPLPPPISPPSSSIQILSPTPSISLDDWNEALAKDKMWKEGICSSKKDWKLKNGNPLFRHKLFVLPELQSHVMYEHHDSLLAGHPGCAKTISLVTRYYNWPLLSKEVQQYVQSCDTCQWTKSSHHAPYGEL